MSELEVIVDFGKGIPSDLQGVTMLAMEKFLRDRGVPACVYKPTKADDLTPRRLMSLDDRMAL